MDVSIQKYQHPKISKLFAGHLRGGTLVPAARACNLRMKESSRPSTNPQLQHSPRESRGASERLGNSFVPLNQGWVRDGAKRVTVTDGRQTVGMPSRLRHSDSDRQSWALQRRECALVGRRSQISDAAGIEFHRGTQCDRFHGWIPRWRSADPPPPHEQLAAHGKLILECLGRREQHQGKAKQGDGGAPIRHGRRR